MVNKLLPASQVSGGKYKVEVECHLQCCSAKCTQRLKCPNLVCRVHLPSVQQSAAKVVQYKMPEAERLRHSSELGPHHPRNITQKYDFHCWWRTCLGPFLAKTSRTAVLTAIMDLSAGGRLYKCLYKMHVDSRAFWGAFWGAFRVFLRDVG